jgi:hypothetical protein
MPLNEQPGAYTTHPDARRLFRSTVGPHSWQRESGSQSTRPHETWNSPPAWHLNCHEMPPAVRHLVPLSQACARSRRSA